ncbi:MAG: response regulator [Myxococcales bacterium]|nr:response regulator [Myxococcales bacterium]
MKRNPARLLIVDDEFSMRDSLAAWFQEDGHDVVAAESAEQALRTLDDHRFDVALLDIKMPGIDGVELLERVRVIDPSIRVIMITAYATVETAVRCLKHGAFDYITKPFKIDLLLDTLTREVELSRRRADALSAPPEMGEKKSKVWAFWSPRSGAGVTSLAINAALEIARVNQKALFIDLDLVFPDSEQLLGLQQMYDLSDLIDEKGRFDAGSARTRTEVHASGLACLYQHAPAGAAKVRPEHVTQMVTGLQKHFDYVILDLPADTGSITGAALDVADAIWLVAGPDPLAARNITKALGLFHTLGYPRSKVHLLLNRVDKASEAVIRELLPDSPKAVLPADPTSFHQAIRTAYPAVLSHPSSPFSRSLKTLVARSLALTTEDSVPPQRGWKDRLMGILKRD